LPVLVAAEEHWHVPPWVIEDDAPQEWWDRYKAYHDELSEFNKSKRRKKKGDSLTD